MAADLDADDFEMVQCGECGAQVWVPASMPEDDRPVCPSCAAEGLEVA